MRRLRVATVFSGIGAFEQSLKKLDINYETVFACDNGERELAFSREEIDTLIRDNNLKDGDINAFIKKLYLRYCKENMMKKAYFANYDINEDDWYEDIRFIDGKKYLNKVDVFVGGSPCQSFSIIGKKAGLEDARGTLFYDYARLIKEIKPKVFIYENVPGMLFHQQGNTWKVIREIFESLDYSLFYKVLNSKDFGIPQERRRLFVVGFKNKDIKFHFPEGVPLTTKLNDYLETSVEPKYYLGKKGFQFVTNPKYKNRARVNREIIQTEKANQQFNWNGDFVFEKYDPKKHNIDIMKRAYLGEYKGEYGVIRQLTHRECMRLMGFPDSYRIVVPNVWAYRQAGNSIVTTVLEAIDREIFKTWEKRKLD